MSESGRFQTAHTETHYQYVLPNGRIKRIDKELHRQRNVKRVRDLKAEMSKRQAMAWRDGYRSVHQWQHDRAAIRREESGALDQA